MKRVLRDRSGTALVLTLIMLTVLIGFAALAVDVGMLYSARWDAQKAADAGALAAASAFGEYGGATGSDSARARAVRFATANKILHRSIGPERVAVDLEPSLATARVVVRGPDLPLWFARVLGMDSAAVAARSAARAMEAQIAHCTKPFAPPDPTPAGAAAGSGGSAAFAVGERIELLGKQGILWDPSDHPSLEACARSNLNYNPNSGPYLANSICSCNANTIVPGAPFTEIKGQKAGNVQAGTEELLALDPDAYWDPVAQRVMGSKDSDWRHSPRIVIVPLYDPASRTGGKVKFNRFIRVFVESYDRNEGIHGRFVEVLQTVRLTQ